MSHWPGSDAWQQGFSPARNHTRVKLGTGFMLSAQSSAPRSKNRKIDKPQSPLLCKRGYSLFSSSWAVSPLQQLLFTRTQRKEISSWWKSRRRNQMCSLWVNCNFFFSHSAPALGNKCFGLQLQFLFCSLFVALGFPVSVPCFLLSLFWFFWLILHNRDRITHDT